MPDFALDWGGDLDYSDTGDWLTVDGAALFVQRAVRRALTNSYSPPGVDGNGEIPSDNVFITNYGGNLRAAVDTKNSKLNWDSIKQTFIRQIQVEAEAERLRTVTADISVTGSGSCATIEGTISVGKNPIVPIPLIELT